MKILSYNSRGLGKKVKCSEVKEYIKKFNIEMCCLQETKLEKIEAPLCRAICSINNIDWVCKNVIGKARGILTIWNIDYFVKLRSWFIERLLVVNGYW
ncbi:hypothetical protein ACS0TY_024915 [Phlomoides rotata]